MGARKAQQQNAELATQSWNNVPAVRTMPADVDLWSRDVVVEQPAALLMNEMLSYSGVDPHASNASVDRTQRTYDSGNEQGTRRGVTERYEVSQGKRRHVVDVTHDVQEFANGAWSRTSTVRVTSETAKRGPRRGLWQ